jgi:hypothetical protein
LTDELTYKITTDLKGLEVKIQVFYHITAESDQLILRSTDGPIEDIIGDLNGASHIATTFIRVPYVLGPPGMSLTYQNLTMYFYLYDQT